MSTPEERSVAGLGLFPSARTLLGVYFAVPSDISKSGIQLFVLGTAVAALRKGIQLLLTLLDRTFITRSYIDSRDEAFHWVTGYLGERKQDALHFTVSTQNNRNVSETLTESATGSTSSISWIPAPGMHLVFHEGRPIFITRSLNGEAGQSNLLKPSERLETLSIATLSITPRVLHSLIQYSRSLFLKKDRSRTVVYSGTQYGGWQRLHSRPIRPLHTVILSPAILQPLLEDIRNYLKRETEEWYADRGVPYRRGYLFTGPPGTGKTSLAVALAGEFMLGVYVVSLSGKGMNDDTLIELLGNMPKRSILLLEDIDVAFPNRATAGKELVEPRMRNAPEVASGVTSSGLLNALDGVAAQEGRIVLMTTNYPQHLDSALIRPGRVDMTVEFELATHEDIDALFCNFFSSAREKDLDGLAESFSTKIGEGRFSIAALQGYLMAHKHDPMSAIQDIDAWVARQV